MADTIGDEGTTEPESSPAEETLDHRSKEWLVVKAMLVERRPIEEVARDYGVSKRWIYELMIRYRIDGDAAFEFQEPEVGVDTTNMLQGSFWASFSGADMRTLVVTIVGTVIGGMLLVVVLALALIENRWWAHSPSSLGLALNGLLGTILAAGLLDLVLRKRSPRLFRIIVWIEVAVVAVLSAVVVLGFVGYAAGIK